MNKRVAWNGAVTGQGNCTSPNQCICLCFDRAWLDEDGEWVDVPWIDPLNRELPPGTGTGFGDCLDGFQGNLNADGSFRTCHMSACSTDGSASVSATATVLTLPAWCGHGLRG